MHTSYMYTYIFYNMADAAWDGGVCEIADLYRFQLRLLNAEALLPSKFRAGRSGTNRLTFIISFSKSQ